MTAEIVKIRKPNYCYLVDLPQRGSLRDVAFGTGWWELDQIFKFYPGQFVVVTGLSGHGKSTFMLNVLVNLARQKGIKSFMYVPENEGSLVEKLSLICGNSDVFDHFSTSQCVVQTSVAKDGDPYHCIEWVLEQAEAAVVHENCEIVYIDPWNELEHLKPKDVLLTDYIRDCLMLIKQFCRRTKAIVIMVAHPTKDAKDRTPTLADIEGSMNWYNKCDNGLIVVREFEKSAARVISAKVREIGAGKVGHCYFDVDPNTGLFTPQHGAVSV